MEKHEIKLKNMCNSSFHWALRVTESVLHLGLCPWHNCCMWLFLNNFMWRFRTRISSLKYIQWWLNSVRKTNKQKPTAKKPIQQNTNLSHMPGGTNPLRLVVIYKGNAVWPHKKEHCSPLGSSFFKSQFSLNNLHLLLPSPRFSEYK